MSTIPRPSPEVRCVLDAKARLGECPRWDNLTQTLYWVDIKSFELHAFHPESKTDRFLKLPEEIGCFSLRDKGGFIAGMRSGFAYIDSLEGGISYIGDPEAHKSDNRFNDGRCDRRGRFWAGTINEAKSAQDGALYRLDIQKHIKYMAGHVLTSNGLAFSPDDKTLYYSDTPNHVIYAYDFDLVTGDIANKRVFQKFPVGKGRPDGAAIDQEGCYWSALYDGASVVRLSPEGDILQKVAIPAQHCTMPAFGGPDLKTVYVTTARDGTCAADLQKYPQAGGIFAFQVDVAGLAEPTFQG